MLGAFVDGALAGYVDYWVMPEELEILNVATAPAHQRRGVASALLARVLVDAQALGKAAIRLEVRRGNDAAQALYRRQGFRPVALRARYYRDGEDAIVMLRELA